MRLVVPFVATMTFVAAGCIFGFLPNTGVGTAAGVTVSTADPESGDRTPGTLTDELQQSAGFYEELSAEFREVRERAATEVLTYADLPQFCRDLASVAQAFHDDLADHSWPASAAESAASLTDDLRVLTPLLEKCSQLPGEEHAIYDTSVQLRFYFGQFDRHDGWLREDLGMIPAGDASTPEQTAAFYAEFVRSANAALAEVGEDYSNLGSDPWRQLPVYCGAAAPLFAEFADQLEGHAWTREVATQGPDLAERSDALSDLLSDCAEQPGIREALEQLDMDIGSALGELLVFSNSIRNAVGMDPVARQTPPFTTLSEHLEVGIAPW